MPSKSAAQKRFMDAAAHNPKFAKQAGVPVDVAKEFSEASKGMKFGAGSRSRPDRQDINKPKTNHGSSAFFAKGGAMKESKAMEMRHVAAMKKAGVPKNIVAQEKAEADAMKKGGKVKKMAFGGPAGAPVAPADMPSQANFGGGARGLDRAAAMSGRTMPSPGGAPAVMPTVGDAGRPDMPALTAAAAGRVPMKKGGKTKCMAGGGATSASTGLAKAASMSGRTMPTPGVGMKKGGGVTRGDGIASKGKTKGRMC